MSNDELQETLFRENVTLDKMVNFCRASKIARRNVKIIKTDNETARS